MNPSRFQGAFLVVKTHQQHRRQRGGFNGHPKQAQIVQQWHGHHRPHKNRRQHTVPVQQGRVDFAQPLFLAEIAHREKPAGQRDEGIESHHQRAERVRPQKSAQGFHRVPGQYFRPQPHRQRGVHREGEKVDPLQDGRFAQPPAQQAGQQWHEDQKHQRHGALLLAAIRPGGIFKKRFIINPSVD